jgi:hypothetical protein
MLVKGCQECKDLHTGWKALTGADSQLCMMHETKLWKSSRISLKLTVGRKMSAHFSCRSGGGNLAPQWAGLTGG